MKSLKFRSRTQFSGRGAIYLSLALSASLCSISLCSIDTARADTSPLWGQNGENWSPAGRLSDWSFAGYRSGETPIPTPPVKGNVRDFGAVGDGVADDSAAFKRAIAATENGALLIPAGRYKVSEILFIRKSNLVLRGEGPDKSVLFFSKGLEEIKSRPSHMHRGRMISGYSWLGGMIWVEGATPDGALIVAAGAPLGTVRSKAARGSQVIELAAAANVKVGQRIVIRQTDPNGRALLEHLYTGQSGDTSKIPNTRTRTSFVSRVARVEGAKITLERPLFTDVDPQWSVDVRIFEPAVSEVGIENLGFDFPRKPYGGHFTEDGFNPLNFLNVTDCWARNLRIFNADSGPFVRGNFITVENIVFDADRAPDESGNRGHHGVSLGEDTLLRNFDFKIKFVHDISVEGFAGGVAAGGKGVDLCFDSHKRFPYANLFTDIDIGQGTRMYQSGGGGGLGRHSGAWSTWWNIRAARAQPYPPEVYGPDSLTFVGITSEQKPVLESSGRWFQPLSPQGLEPRNLYEAQLAQRLAKQGTAK